MVKKQLKRLNNIKKNKQNTCLVLVLQFSYAVQKYTISRLLADL